MKHGWKKITVALLVIIVAFFAAKPVFGAKGETPTHQAVEYKVVLELGKRSTISKMEKALDSFVEQQKGKAILEIDLKKMGDAGWELVFFERESGYAIFKRPVEDKK